MSPDMVFADDGEMHTVTIYDEHAKRLADLFLPPPGSMVSVAELREACRRLAEAANAMKKLERDGGLVS
jgi:hypothetical protein